MQREHSLPGENWKLKVLLCPCKETFQVRLANPPNRVDVGCQNVRGKHTIGFNTLKKKPKTDLKNSRIWSNTHASCAPSAHRN